MNLKLKTSLDYYAGGIIHFLLKPFVYFLGIVLGRDHSLEGVGEVTVLKMLGGGSLVIAYPSLLALKAARPGLRLNLVTTPPIRDFAELLGVFDEIIVLRDDHAFHLALDSLRAIARLWCTPALIDLEIHSRLSSIFSLLTCARNRIGIYTDDSYWRRSLYTHLLFYNEYAPVYLAYDQIVRLFGAPPGDYPSAKAAFRAAHPEKPGLVPVQARVRMGVAPACSDLGRERMLSPAQWISVLGKKLALEKDCALLFIGGKRDGVMAEEIISGLRQSFPQAEFHNCCGQFTLRDSVALIAQLDALYCIDSGLIHFARLLQVKTLSFWGPTDPAARLRPAPGVQEETHYLRLSCSPCVHIAAEAPCYGNNLCMSAAVEGEAYAGDRNPLWPAQPKPDLRHLQPPRDESSMM